MRAGQVGSVHVSSVDPGGNLRVTLAPAIPPWWWFALVGACPVPAVGSAVRSSR